MSENVYSLEHLQNSLSEKKGLARYNPEEIMYATTPIGKAIYDSGPDNYDDNSKSHWSDRIECKLCGKIYTRSTSSRHKKTQYHRIYEEMNNKLRMILLDQNKKVSK